MLRISTFFPRKGFQSHTTYWLSIKIFKIIIFKIIIIITITIIIIIIIINIIIKKIYYY